MEWLLIIFLLSFSAFFSGLESALFSLSQLDRHRLKQSGGVSALIVKALERPREVLTTILFGNELVNVAISILAASLVYHYFSPDWHSRTSYLLSVGVTTLMILIFGEIVPKNVAVRNPILFSQFLILPYQIFSWVVTPFRYLFTGVINRVVGLFGIQLTHQRRLIMEEEIKTLLELGRQEGTLDDLERNLIQNVFDFSALRVLGVMTPRTEMVMMLEALSISEVFQLVEQTPFSRFPVYRGDPNNVVGIFLTKNLLPFRIADPDVSAKLSDLLIPFVVVQPDQTLDEAFFLMRSKQVHMAIVKQGQQVVGLVTMDDLLRKFFK